MCKARDNNKNGAMGLSFDTISLLGKVITSIGYSGC